MVGGRKPLDNRKWWKRMIYAQEDVQGPPDFASHMQTRRLFLHYLSLLEPHGPTNSSEHHLARFSKFSDHGAAEVDGMGYCDSSTGLSPKSSGNPDNEWMVHFVTARNPHDRRFHEYEAGIHLPADTELSRNADEFEVLFCQVRRGGIIPGFPDGMKRRYSPKPTIIAQDVSRVVFGKRFSRCGILFRRNEFVHAGGMQEVIPGRPDLEFADLLAWDTNNKSAEVIRFYANGELDGALGLPLYNSRSPFSAIGILVDDEEQAGLIGEFLTKQYLGLRQYEVDFRNVRSQLRRTFILWEPEDCDDRDHPRCPIPGLRNFTQRTAVTPSADILRHKVVVDRAIACARSAAGKFRDRSGSWWPHEYRTMFIDFQPGPDPIADYLISTKIVEPVEDGETWGRYRFNLDIEGWSSPQDQRAMFEAAERALEDHLGIGFYVRTYVE